MIRHLKIMPSPRFAVNSGNQMRDLLAEKFLGTKKETRDLMTVAEMAITNGVGEPQVFEEIAKMVSGFVSSEAHKRIASFTWRGIATTNYDRFIEQGYLDNKDSKQTCLPFVKSYCQIWCLSFSSHAAA